MLCGKGNRMAATQPSTVDVDGRQFRVTNLDKVMYPATGTTKAEVIAYARTIAPWFIRHSDGRPATRKRWPDGVGTEGGADSFFEKNLRAAGTPNWVVTAGIEHTSGTNNYPLVNDAATLAWLAQMGALEVHVPQWRFREEEGRFVAQNPDRLVLDLDPGPGATKAQLVELAHLLKEVLHGAGMPCVPVTSGSKGIHLYAGLDGAMTSKEASGLAHQLARQLERARPDLVVSDMKKSLREGKVLLDWSQNNGNKTTISPWSLRGRKFPTVAAPRRWEELTEEFEQLEFTDALERMEVGTDPLADLLDLASLDEHRRRRSPSSVAASGEEAAASPVAPVVQLHRRKAGPGTVQLLEIAPMLATAGDSSRVADSGWVCEVKWDGYRAMARVAGGKLQLTSRGGIDLSSQYPELAQLVAAVGTHDAVIDGEIVAFDDAGRAAFNRLQNHARRPGTAHFVAFDLLQVDDEVLVDMTWEERRERLESLLVGVDRAGSHVHLPETMGSDVEEAIAISKDLGLEGIVAKRRESTYQTGVRSPDWVKIKHVRTQAAVVIGMSPGKNSRSDTFGALLLAVHDAGALRYIGKVGTGFDDEELRAATTFLGELRRDLPPVPGVPPLDARNVRWVEPLVVCEVTFAQWSEAGRLRHPVWRGWRPDMRVEDVSAE